jgi:hypothetical protein
MDTLPHSRRPGAATALAAMVIGAVLGMAGCGAGDGNNEARPSARASERSVDRSTADEPESTRSATAQPTRSREPESTKPPAETTTPPTTETTKPAGPTRTPTPAETTTRPPTTEAAAPGPAQTTRSSTPTRTTTSPTPSKTTASAVPAAAESSGIGPFGWFILIALLAAVVIGGLLVYRAQRKSAWDTEARALESETRTLTATRLSSVLTVGTAAQRSLAWPPLRADLVALVSRWNALVERAVGEERRNLSLQIRALLQDLVAAVDAENEALAVGEDWTLLRPRVRQVQQALAEVLAVQPWPEPPAAGEPGPRAFQS